MVDDMFGAHPHKQVGTEEEAVTHSMQSRDQLSMVNGMIPGHEGSDLQKPKIKIGDEVNAYLRVKGNKVKEITGIVSEISKNGCTHERGPQKRGVSCAQSGIIKRPLLTDPKTRQLKDLQIALQLTPLGERWGYVSVLTYPTLSSQLQSLSL